VKDVLVVGAGVFGVTAALELAARGRRVELLDPGPLPHPDAASTDISKVVRMEYGSDEAYLALGERAREGWLRWNDELEDTLYHETGCVMLSRTPMAERGFEYESFRRLVARGHPVERLDERALAERFPAFRRGAFADGYLNPRDGWAESGRVVEALLRKARRAGVALETGRCARLLEKNDRVTGIETRGGERIAAGVVVVAAGAWTGFLVPKLEDVLRSVGQPVFHLEPRDPALFEPPRFPVFSADVARTGWYGFPFHPRARVLKVAHHGAGRAIDPERDERRVQDRDVARLRGFLADVLPALADAPLAATRLCLYCDTPDEHFFIGRDPGREGLVVAAGGSGHAFKFAPLLGAWIADALEGRPNPEAERFAWRAPRPGARGEEATRHRDPPASS